MNRSALKRFQELGDGRTLVASVVSQQLSYMEATAELLQEISASHDRQMTQVTEAVGRLLAAVEKNRAVTDARSDPLQASAAPGEVTEFIRDATGRLTGMRKVPLAPDGLPADGYLQRQIEEMLEGVDLGDVNGNGAS